MDNIELRQKVTSLYRKCKREKANCNIHNGRR